MYFKSYLNSFKPRKQIGYTILVDIFCIAIIAIMLLAFVSTLNYQSNKISQGKSIEEIKVMLLSGSETYNQEFVKSIQGLVFTMLFGIIFILMITLFLFSASQALIWNKLTGQKPSLNKYWKWNLTNLIIVVFMMILIIIYLVILAPINLLLPQTTLIVWILKIFNLAVILAFIMLTFMIYFSFVHKYKVGESISHGFSLIKSHWSKLWRAHLFCLITFVLLNLILSLILKALNSSINSYILQAANILILLVFSSWMRNYITSEVKMN